MNITQFYDVDLQNREATQEFIDLNAVDHETIYNALLSQNQIVIDHYPLWSPDGVTDDWLFLHAREHNSISFALLLSAPVDLDTLDTKDAEASNFWMQNHLLAHQLIIQSLGL